MVGTMEGSYGLYDGQLLKTINAFSGKEYIYDPAQRVDSFIVYEKKQFQTSKSSKWQRGRRIVKYLTDMFGTHQ